MNHDSCESKPVINVEGRASLYGGYIQREYFDNDDFPCSTISRERILVRAFDSQAAAALIHQIYDRDQKCWTPDRTSENHPDDGVFVADLQTLDDLV